MVELSVLFSDGLELFKYGIWIGGLLSVFCYVIGSVINILFDKVIKKGW